MATMENQQGATMSPTTESVDEDLDDEEESFSTEQLFSFAWQIARGMVCIVVYITLHRSSFWQATACTIQQSSIGRLHGPLNSRSPTLLSRDCIKTIRAPLTIICIWWDIKVRQVSLKAVTLNRKVQKRRKVQYAHHFIVCTILKSVVDHQLYKIRLWTRWISLQRLGTVNPAIR